MRQPLLIALLALLALGPFTGCSREARKNRALSRADQYFAHGDYDQARIQYLKVLRFDPQSTTAYARLGDIWLDEGSLFRAAAFLLKARELAPDNLTSRLKLARVLLSLGRRADALEELNVILARSPGNGNALWILAEATKTPEEIDRLNQELGKFPNKDDAGFLLASAISAIHENNPARADEALNRAVKLNPKSSSAHLLMATYWIWQKDASKAGAEFKVAADLAPVRSPERLKYAEFLVQSGATDQAVEYLKGLTKQAPDYLAAWNLLANLARRRNDYEQSLKLLDNVTNRDGEDIDANLFRAEVLLAKGDTDRAREAFEGLDRKYPNFAQVKFGLAQCYLKKNNIPSATSALQQTLVANPDFVQASLVLGRLDLHAGKAQAAADAMNAVLKKHPNLMDAKLLLADAYRALGRLDDAAVLFRDQIKQVPQSAQAYAALGIVLRQQKKYDEARQALEKGLDLAPNNPAIVFQLIDLEISIKDYDAALKTAQQQSKSKPDSALGPFLEARVYATQRQWDLAEQALTRCLSVSRDFTAAYSLLASVYLATNKLPDAAQQLETVLAKNPNDRRALMTLGIIYEKLQAFPKARAVYEKLTAITPDFAPALNNLAYLDAEFFNETERAYQLARKAHDLQPSDSSIADTLGWVLYKKHDYEGAIPLLRESAAKTPNEPQMQYHLAMAQYMAGDQDAARNSFEQALKAPADFRNKQDAQRRLTLLSVTAPASNVSVEELKSIVHDQPDDVIAWSRLGELYEKQGAFKDAAASYEQAVSHNPRLGQILFKLAELDSGPLNDNAKALEYAKDARELSAGDPHATLLLGRIALRAGNGAWAYSLLKQAADGLENDPQVFHQLAWAAFSLGRISEAKANMESVIARTPESAEAADARRFRSLIAISEQPDRANISEAEVAKILRDAPDYVPAELAQAAIESKHGRIRTATDWYERALTRFPDLVPAQKALATLYARDPATVGKAYDIALKARKNLPDDTDLANLLAELSYQRKDYSRALQLFQESARKQRLDPEHLYYFGMCSFYTKQNSQARDALDRALAAGLQDPLAADARRALATLNN